MILVIYGRTIIMRDQSSKSIEEEMLNDRKFKDRDRQ